MFAQQHPPRAAVLFSPIVFGALLIFYRTGVSIPVLIGGPAGLIVALRLYRRHVQGVR